MTSFTVTNYSKEFVIFFFWVGGKAAGLQMKVQKVNKPRVCSNRFLRFAEGQSSRGRCQPPHLGGISSKMPTERDKKGQLAAMGLVCSFSHC